MAPETFELPGYTGGNSDFDSYRFRQSVCRSGSFAVPLLSRTARPRVNESALLLAAMRIDPKASIRGVPVLRLRELVRALNSRVSWDLETIQTVLSVSPQEAEQMLSALEAADLASRRRGRGSKTWTTTARAQAFASATAAKPITRQTAKRELAEFLDRVERVNSDDRFLAKVTE